MRFLNYFTFLCCKTLSYSVKVKYMNLHTSSVKHSFCYTNSLNCLKIQHLCRVRYDRIHSSVSMWAKFFRETENEYAHEVLQAIPTYSESTIRQPISMNVKDFSDGNKALSDFAKVTMKCMSLNITLEDGPFSLTVSNLIKSLPNLSNENILKCLFLLCCLPPTPKTWTPNFKALWNSLDSECVQRLQTWNTSLKLLVADHWFHLRLNRISQYNRSMIVDLMQRLNELTDAEIVQLMFYVNLQRELHFNSLKVLEARLIPVVRNISIHELGIVCLGFFKTQNKLNDISIIKTVIERFINEIEVAENLTLVSLLKFLKKSIQLSYTELYIPLLHKCTSYTSKWDVHTCIHLALLASECHVYHPLLLDSITDRLCSDIKHARLKDMMKLLQCLSHFNHLPPENFNTLLFSEIQKKSRHDEIEQQPRILIYIALYYSYFGYYNYKLLNVVLDSDFAQGCISTFPETDLTFAEVDCSVEIECKDYTGNRLCRHFWNSLERRRRRVDLNANNAFTRLVNEILSAFTSKENIQNTSTFENCLVFVYGTLKVGEPNNDQMIDASFGKATYVSRGRTLQKWPLVIASRFNIPFLLYRKGVGKNVIGEIFSVDRKMLSHMDAFECHPTYYTRIKVEVEILEKENAAKFNLPVIVRPWIYFLLKFHPNLLILPYLEDYHSKGSHGLEYISSEDTTDPEDIYK